MTKFVHLHTHSHYSLLNALPQIPDLVAAAKKAGFESLALTDNGNLYGAIEFYEKCRKEGIKPIIGVDAYVAARTRFDKEARLDNARSRLVLLAKDGSGYKSLLQMVTDSFLEGFYYKPRIDRELIEKYREGLICINPSFSGDIALAVKSDNLEKARELAEWYKSVFGEDFYIEITHHPEIQGHEEAMAKLVEFAKNAGVPIMAAHDVYYLKKEDARAREVLMSIANGGGPRSDALSEFESQEDFSFIDGKTAEKYFKKLPEALENTAKIAELCNCEIALGEWKFPNIEIPAGRTADEVLRDIVFEGIEKRGLEKTQEVLDRIEYELKVIKDKGYAKYFLVVSDLLRHAHENGILTTIRGSVGGSLVTFLAFITNVNPLVYKLPFERFLNPERPSAPDIDMDYADNRRDEMISYAKQKYGADKVAQIGTFGTMMARGAVRDVARALGFPYGTGDTIAKLIPMGSQGFPMTIDRALKMEPDLKRMYQSDPDAKEIIDMAKKIEGCARHISVHAAGVVISPTPLTDYVPLQLDPKGEGKVITQYDMHSVDENAAGLLKFDFLGIRNLSILADAVSLVKKIEGIDIDIENIPLDDKKTFEMLARGETIGLFQLNGTGMTRYLMDLKPTTIFDINAMVALYRPGPMEMIPEYVKRKHDPSLVKYLDPRLKDILDQSYGIITYQDDVMLIAIHLAGYSWLEADKLRKAMGKKIPAEMEAQKTKLHEGFLANGLSEEKAKTLWSLIEPFAAYGFNKAHAASYGKVAYQTAYMKANFPAIYMSAVLTAESGDTDTVAEVINECTRMNIPVLPPDINESFEGFTVVKTNGEGDKIRFGLTTIKNFGEGIAHAIIEERKRGGKFASLADFLDRVTDRNLNKKSLESLVKCGAMDAFGERGQMLANLESMVRYNKEGSTTAAGQTSLFGLMSDTSTIPTLKLDSAPPASQSDKLSWEKELLGLYISGHPLDRFKEKFAARGENIKLIKETKKEGQEVVVGGIIAECKDIYTKKGDKMLFLTVSDLSDSVEMVVFPRVYAEFHDLLKPENCVVIKGKISHRNGSVSMIADKVRLL
ncbi:MAG TPA: DNA polymerase III subunit alpha [Candidatus Paceibacterota bacterium]|jgi:DNA polymerase-3 subunit alpha|nr:DNA polymerase III subunit alpha [Candidatus Paceibacterota bacterium]